jgi:PilZ domain
MEQRASDRHRILKAATIEFGGGCITCTVRNVSDSGAMLDVSSPVGIPEHVWLVIPTEGKRLSCRIVWRKEKPIGVTFE